MTTYRPGIRLRDALQTAHSGREDPEVGITFCLGGPNHTMDFVGVLLDEAGTGHECAGCGIIAGRPLRARPM